MIKQLPIIILVACASATCGLGQSASKNDNAPLTEIKTPARLRTRTAPTHEDEVFTSGDGDSYVLRSGSNIRLPLTEGAPAHFGLDSALSTRGLSEGRYLYRNLPLRGPIEGAYGPLYPAREIQVETRISGHSSGMIKRAGLLIEPQTFLVEVTENDFIQIAMKDGQPVYLKPGKWFFHLHCSLESIESDGYSWTAPTDSESFVKGSKFQSSAKPPISEEQAGILLFVQPMFYVVARASNELIMLFHRPNITLPATTDLHFRVNEIDATYMGPASPKIPGRKAQ
jgi:hypothetical protein